MNANELKQRFRAITVWKRGTQRAPHKPLLLLYALSKALRGEPREIPYVEVDRNLRELLIEFGPERKSYHTEYPFWRLQNDGIWELANAEHVEARQSNTDAKKTELIKYGVAGGFTSEIYKLLEGNNGLVSEIALDILAQHFPLSLYGDILQSVGLSIETDQVMRRRRDPKFRIRVLTAYGYQCCVCGYDVRLGSRELGLEAAHVKWHQAGGPDTERNGLALCVLHHKLFDRGAFTLSSEREIWVSQFAHGTRGFSEWLLSFHGQLLRSPQSRDYWPSQDFLDWHRVEVFHGPARETSLN